MTFSGEGTNFTLVLPLQVGLIPDGIANTWGQLSPQVHCSAFHPGRLYSITHSAKQAKQLDRVVFWRKYLYVSDRLTQLAILCGALSAALSSVSSDGVDQKQKPNQNPTKDHRPLSSAWTKAATISGAINGRRGLCSGVLFFFVLLSEVEHHNQLTCSNHGK